MGLFGFGGPSKPMGQQPMQQMGHPQQSKPQGLGPAGSLQPRGQMGGGSMSQPMPQTPMGGGMSPSYGMPPMPQINNNPNPNAQVGQKFPQGDLQHNHGIPGPGSWQNMMGGGFRDRMTEPYGFNGEMAKPGYGGAQPYQAAGGLGPSAEMSQAPNQQTPPPPNVAGAGQIQGPGTVPGMIKGTENEQELMGSMFNRGPMNTSMFDPRFRNFR